MALREMQAHFTKPRVVATLVIVALALGFAGPFGTYDLLPLVPRIAYWVGMTVATYGVGYAAGSLLSAYAGDRLHPEIVRIAVTGIVCGVPVTLAVMLLNMAVFGLDGWRIVDPPMLLASVIVISMGVSALFALLSASPTDRARGLPAAATGTAEAAATAVTLATPPPPPPPPILQRLPPAVRGKLLALSVEDHYVDVVTDRGHHLLLMRLGDAMRETGVVEGLQIHRSHWVALDAVRRTIRADGRVLVELSDGRKLPVARGQISEARAAGILT